MIVDREILKRLGVSKKEAVQIIRETQHRLVDMRCQDNVDSLDVLCAMFSHLSKEEVLQIQVVLWELGTWEQ